MGLQLTGTHTAGLWLKGTRQEGWQKLGTQEASWQPSEQLAWHTVAWGWVRSGQRTGLVQRLLPRGSLHTGLWRPGHAAPGCLPRSGLLTFLLVPPSGLFLGFPVAVIQCRKLLLSRRLTVTQRPCDFWNRSLGWMGKGRQLGTGAPLHDFQGPPQVKHPVLCPQKQSHPHRASVPHCDLETQ